VTLHIAVVNRHPDDAVGGSELQCDLFARELAARGHHVTYVALHAPGAARGAAAGAGDAPYARVPLDSDATSDPERIARAVLAARADVVYWRYGREHLAEVAAVLSGADPAVPVVLAVAHVDDVARWPALPLARGGARHRAADVRRRLEHRRSWRAFRQVAAIAAQRQDFLGRAPVARQVHVPNVVDPTIVPFTWPRPYVAWVANLKPRKRPEQLVPLAAVLARHGIDLLVAGAVQDSRYASFTVPDPDVPNLHPLGLLPPAQAAGLIAGARCLAVTARPEGLSNAMIQAWWHGVPTVSLDYDPDGTIAAARLGEVCGGDPVAFRAAVLAHADGGEVASAAGVRARAYARERFSRERNGALLEELLVATVAAAG
jgi:glycosyltransferase involved in cell wall biosynthesis